MTSKRERSAIDAMARLISLVQEAREEGKLTEMVLIDIKGAFDKVSRNNLLRTIEGMGNDGDLMRWTESFMSNTTMGLLIIGHQCAEAGVETGVP